MAQATIKLITSSGQGESGNGDPGSVESLSETRRFTRLGRECWKFEGEILDLKYMAHVVASTIENMLGDNPESITGNKEFYFLPQSTVEVGMFTVLHLERMINAFVDQYYSVIEAE
jgi:hypothetical protein